MTSYRSRNFVLAASLALVSGLFTMLYVAKSGSAEASADPAARTVYVAAKDIAPGTPAEQALGDGLLTVRQLPGTAVAPGAVTGRGVLRGKVAVGPIYAGEQVTLRRLAPERARGVLADLRGTMRAIKLAGDGNQLLTGILRAGDRVDVVAALKAATGRPATGRIVLRDLLVLRAPERDASAVGGSTGPHSVTLRLTDRQAQQLFFVARTGEWSLVLRPAIDAADGPEAVETAASVLRGDR